MNNKRFLEQVQQLKKKPGTVEYLAVIRHNIVDEDQDRQYLHFWHEMNVLCPGIANIGSSQLMKLANFLDNLTDPLKCLSTEHQCNVSI